MFCLWWHNWRQQRIIINPLFSGQMEIIKLNKKNWCFGSFVEYFHNSSTLFGNICIELVIVRYSDFREEFQRVINLDPRWRLPISATSIQVVWTDNPGLQRQRQIKRQRQRQMFANISHLNPGGMDRKPRITKTKTNISQYL